MTEKTVDELTSDDWHTNFDSGMIDDFDFTITSASFSVDAQYSQNEDDFLLKLDGFTDNPEQPEHHEWIRCGKGWVSEDGGATITHQSGNPKKYWVKGSAMATWIGRCVDEFGMKELLSARGGPRIAAVWVGLTFHMLREEIDYGGEIGKKNKLFPVRFVGVATNGAAPASAAVASPPPAAAAASAPAAAAPAAAPPGESAADKIARIRAGGAAPAAAPSMRDQVVAIFGAHTDFQAAQLACLESVPGIDSNEEMLDAISDESGLWAEVKASV